MKRRKTLGDERIMKRMEGPTRDVRIIGSSSEKGPPGGNKDQ